MAARSRPRALPKDETDAHEERDLWSKIVNNLKDLARKSKRIHELADEIAAEEARLQADDGGQSNYLHTIKSQGLIFMHFRTINK
jgi:SAGA-associated factor 29